MADRGSAWKFHHIAVRQNENARWHCAYLRIRKDKKVASNAVERENGRLLAANERLKGLLKSHGIPYEPKPEPPRCIDSAAEAKRRIDMFMKLFCARRDFYAERWESKEGRTGYSPVCSNRWKPICPKKVRGIKCHECDKQDWVPFSESVAYKHLVGQDERGKPYVAGTYALLEDSTCKFLVFDFDDHDGSHVGKASLLNWGLRIHRPFWKMLILSQMESPGNKGIRWLWRKLM
jgi:hypothetical protein